MDKRWHISNSKAKLATVCGLIARFPVGETDDLELVLRTRHVQRSSEQNRRYWHLLNEIAEHPVAGQKYVADIWHEYLKGKFIGKEEIKLPNGETLNRPLSTTSLDVAAFGEYMTQIEAWAAQHGILLDDRVAA